MIGQILSSLFLMPMAVMAESNHPHEGMEMQHDMMKKQDAVMGTGVVHKIDSDNRKINVTHEPIEALKWPKMTMDLDVVDSVDLSKLQSGEAIKFHIEMGDDKVYRITEIIPNSEKHEDDHSGHQH